jgi:hypothetical protein
MANCSWKDVPTALLGTFSERYNGIMQTVQAIQTFNVMRSGIDLPGEVARCKQSFQTQWNSFYSFIAQHLLFAEGIDAGTGNFKETLAGILQDAAGAKNRFADELNKLKADLAGEQAKMMAAFGDKIKSVAAEMGGVQVRIQDMETRQKKNMEQMSKQQEAVLAADRERITKRVADLESSTTHQLTEALERQKKAVEEDRKRMDLLVAGIEQKAKSGAITQQSVYFKSLADRYLFISIIWLLASLGAGLALFFYVDGFQLPDIKDRVLLAEHLVPRLIAVTLLSTALIFCIRNFSAMMHNMVVNRHRQTALTTFQIFVDGTSDATTKNAVLVQSTQAIFAPQPSGYLKTDQEMPQMNQVTEIVRNISGKEKG